MKSGLPALLLPLLLWPGAEGAARDAADAAQAEVKGAAKDQAKGGAKKEAKGAAKDASFQIQEMDIRDIEDKGFVIRQIQRGGEHENSSGREIHFLMSGAGEGWLLPDTKIALPKAEAKDKTPPSMEILKGGIRLDLLILAPDKNLALKIGDITMRLYCGSAATIRKNSNDTELLLSEGKAGISVAADKPAEAVESGTRTLISAGTLKSEKIAPERLFMEIALAKPLSIFPLDLKLVKVASMKVQKAPPQMRISGAENSDDKGFVQIGGFWLGKYEVSNRQWMFFEQWFELTKNHRYCHPAESAGFEHFQGREEAPCYADLYQEELPAVGVSWWDAFAFCGFAGGRLPSELEWMAAAYWQGGKWAPLPWGNAGEKDRKIGKYANYQDLDFMRWQQENSISWDPLDGSVDERDGFALSAPAGKFPAGKSACGVFDTAGNVSEWVNARGFSGGRVARGGNWGHPFEAALSTGMKLEYSPETRSPMVGLRLLRDEDFPKPKKDKEKKNEPKNAEDK